VASSSPYYSTASQPGGGGSVRVPWPRCQDAADVMYTNSAQLQLLAARWTKCVCGMTLGGVMKIMTVTEKDPPCLCIAPYPCIAPACSMQQYAGGAAHKPP
jgi:hypothetical protein